MPREVEISIDPALCKGCGICVFVCPRQVLGMSKARGKQGYLLPALVDKSRCTGCLLCELECPDVAINIETDKEKPK